MSEPIEDPDAITDVEEADALAKRYADEDDEDPDSYGDEATP